MPALASARRLLVASIMGLKMSLRAFSISANAVMRARSIACSSAARCSSTLLEISKTSSFFFKRLFFCAAACRSLSLAMSSLALATAACPLRTAGAFISARKFLRITPSSLSSRRRSVVLSNKDFCPASRCSVAVGSVAFSVSLMARKSDIRGIRCAKTSSTIGSTASRRLRDALPASITSAALLSTSRAAGRIPVILAILLRTNSVRRASSPFKVVAVSPLASAVFFASVSANCVRSSGFSTRACRVPSNPSRILGRTFSPSAMTSCAARGAPNGRSSSGRESRVSVTAFLIICPLRICAGATMRVSL